MEQDEICRKILALLALSASPNEAEANVAATKAAELITRYNIDMVRLEQDARQAAEPCTHEACYEATFATGWRKYLANACAFANFCQYYIDHAEKSRETMERLGPRYTSDKWTRIMMYGRKTNVMAAIRMFQYLEQTVLRLGNEAMREYKMEWEEFGIKIKTVEWADSWRKGCTTRLYQRLAEQRREIEREERHQNEPQGDSETTAIAINSLALIRKEEAERYIKSAGIVLSISKTAAALVNDGAYQKGRQDADNISLSAQLVGSR